MMNNELHKKTPCISCGYDLVGLGADGVCPECGHSIRKTLAAEQLASLPDGKLRSIQVGAVIVASALCSGPLVGLATLFALRLAPMWVWLALGGIWIAVLTVGLWLFATSGRAPATRTDGAEEASGRLRMLAFVIAITGVATVILFPLSGMVVLVLLAFLAEPICLILLESMLAHTQFLAERVPNTRILVLIHTAEVVWVVGVLVALLGFVFSPLHIVGIVLVYIGFVIGAVALLKLGHIIAQIRRERDGDERTGISQ